MKSLHSSQSQHLYVFMFPPMSSRADVGVSEHETSSNKTITHGVSALDSTCIVQE